MVNSILRITKQTGPRAVDRSRLLTNSSDQAAVLDQLDGDVVVVHAGGFRVDAQEIFATKEATVVSSFRGACAGAAAEPTKGKQTGREDDGFYPTDYNYRHKISVQQNYYRHRAGLVWFGVF